jgi:hypothetical protein
MDEAENAARKQVEARGRDEVGPGEVARRNSKRCHEGGEDGPPAHRHDNFPKNTPRCEAIKRRRIQNIIADRGKAVPEQHDGERHSPNGLRDHGDERGVVIECQQPRFCRAVGQGNARRKIVIEDLDQRGPHDRPGNGQAKHGYGDGKPCRPSAAARGPGQDAGSTKSDGRGARGHLQRASEFAGKSARRRGHLRDAFDRGPRAEALAAILDHNEPGL